MKILEIGPIIIEGILISHDHMDHAGTMSQLAMQFKKDTPIYAHPDAFYQLSLGFKSAYICHVLLVSSSR